MKIIFLLVLSMISLNSFASMRVMTFNTTCSLGCEKGEWDKFKYRKHWIVDTVKRTNPDLIAFQEVFHTSQLRWFKKKLKDYKLYYHRKFYIFRFADPALFVRKDRFSLVRWGGFWLGPMGKWFSFGWKFAIPRRIQWTRLFDNDTGKEFYFISSHFDNRPKNKTKSADVLIKSFKNVTAPIIFAADTNLKPHTDGYKNLNKTYYNSYDLKENFELIKNSKTDIHDSCNLTKGKVFPECRVDHIFLSRDAKWRVFNWGVDQFKYGKRKKFTSDHRAIFADIELL